MTVLPYQELWWALPELDRVRPSHWSFRSERGRVSVTAHRREEEVTYLFKNPIQYENTSRRIWQFQNASLRPFLHPDEGGKRELVLVKKDGCSFLYGKVSRNKEIHISGNRTGIPLGSFPHPLPRRTMKYSDRAPYWWECFREAARFVGEDRRGDLPQARTTPIIIPLSYIHYNYRWLKATDGQRAVTLMCVDSVAFEHEGGEFNIRPTPYLLSKRSTFPFAKILGVDLHAEYLMFCAKPWYYSLPINYWPYPSATF